MTVLILGATSDMSVALVKLFAAKGHNLQLAGTDMNQLSALKSDTELRYNVLVDILEFNALNYLSHFHFYHKLIAKPDLVILVFGYLGSQESAIADWDECKKIIETNYVGAVSILNVIANDFEKRGSGTIVGITSVAGERGRMSNYLYGSAKAGLSAYLSGLRNRLYSRGVHVISVKPGFVRTKMTENLALPRLVTTSPERVAELIYKGVMRKTNTLYILPIWRFIMLGIKFIPEMIFKRMKL